MVFAAYFVQKIGVGTLLSSRDTAFAARQAAWTDPATRSIMYALSIYPLLVGVGAMAVLRRSTTRHRRLYLLIIFAAAALLLIVVNPVSSARYSMGTVWFALLVYAGAMLTKRRRRITMVGAIAGLIFVFPLADAFRRTTVDVTWDGFFGEYKGSPDYDAFWQIANAYSFVARRAGRSRAAGARDAVLLGAAGDLGGQTDRHRHPAGELPRLPVHQPLGARCGRRAW